MLLWPVGGWAQASLSLDELMRRLGSVPARQARFVEEKQMAALAKPLEAQGRLIYARPGHLEKVTESPSLERLVADGDRAWLQTENRTEMVFLPQHPELRALIDAIRGTLGGDLAALEEFYSVELTGSLEDWRLTLTPKGERVAKYIRKITVQGQDAEPKRIETIEADGDTSRMTITPISQ
jgi:outer membrane lipoprotein-sorting protein